MLNLENLKEGNWVVLRNGECKQVKYVIRFRSLFSSINRLCVGFGTGIGCHFYNEDGTPLYRVDSELTPEDIVSIWDCRPTRGAIISKIKKGSFVNFRDGRREQVEKINGNANRFQYYIKTKDSIGYYFNDGRRYTTKSEADIVSVEC